MGKTARVDLRLDEADDYLIRRAAEVSGASVSSFMVASARVEAAHVLADRTVFPLDEQQARELDRRLRAKPRTKKRLKQLAEAPELFR